MSAATQFRFLNTSKSNNLSSSLGSLLQRKNQLWLGPLMENLLLIWIFGIVGNIVSVLVFLSPIRAFWSVVKKKSTENYKVGPCITTLLSTSLWTIYGIVTHDGMLVLTANGAGVFLHSIYVFVFFIYAPRDKKIRTSKLVGLFNVGFVGLVILVTLVATHDGQLRHTIVGSLSAALTFGMYVAPISAMSLVMKTKSVEHMPLLLSFFLFLNGGVWATYGVLMKDFNVGVAHAINGFIVGSSQLILYAIYKKKSSNISGEDEEAAISMNNKT